MTVYEWNNSLQQYFSKYECQREQMKNEQSEKFMAISSLTQSDMENNFMNDEMQIRLNEYHLNHEQPTSYTPETQEISQNTSTVDQLISELQTNSPQTIYRPQNEYEQQQSNVQKAKNIQEAQTTNKIMQRIGHNKQPYVQKIWFQQTNFHLLKNIESRIRTIIKNGLKRIKKIKLLGNQKIMNKKQLNNFVRNPKLSRDQWQEILDLSSIQVSINVQNSKIKFLRQIKLNQSKKKSKKLTQKQKKSKPMNQKQKKFILNLGKEILKIIMRSVRRLIFKCLDGQDILCYLDEEAHSELNGLDKMCEQYQKLKQQYEKNIHKNHVQWEVKLADKQQKWQGEKSNLNKQQNQGFIEKSMELVSQNENIITPQQFKYCSTLPPTKQNLHLSSLIAQSHSNNINENSIISKNFEKGGYDSLQAVNQCQKQ